MVIDERQIPVRETVKGACEILGLDPLYVANEGKLLAIVASDSVAAVLHRRSRERSPGNGANGNRHWRHAVVDVCLMSSCHAFAERSLSHHVESGWSSIPLFFSSAFNLCGFNFRQLAARVRHSRMFLAGIQAKL
jgi:hypothetical protein